MTDTVTAETTTRPPPPPSMLTEALRNPSHLVARRAEFVKFAAARAQQAAAAARARLQNAEAVATARAQELRKSTDALVTTTVARIRKVSVPAGVRSAVSSGLVRAGQALDALGKRIESITPAPVETPAPKTE
jgi:hypothetical protein